MSDLWSLAQRHRDVLRFDAFVQAPTVSRYLGEAEGLAEAASLLRGAGVDKVYLDVYRAHIPEEAVLARAGLAVAGNLDACRVVAEHLAGSRQATTLQLQLALGQLCLKLFNPLCQSRRVSAQSCSAANR